MPLTQKPSAGKLLSVSAPTIDRNSRRAKSERLIVRLTIFLGGLTAIALLIALRGPFYAAYFRYHPEEGDVVFQSLPPSAVVRAIEGATRSPYSHCGIVAREGGEWVVFEAYREVAATPLHEFLVRGREQGFAVYRWKVERRHHLPAVLAQIRRFLGRPYDARYRLDDESIYCSELIYKAYRAAVNEPLGKLTRLDELDWRPFVTIIERIEGGPPPLEREIITPVALARATELEPLLTFRMPAYDAAGADSK